MTRIFRKRAVFHPVREARLANIIARAYHRPAIMPIIPGNVRVIMSPASIAIGR